MDTPNSYDRRKLIRKLESGAHQRMLAARDRVRRYFSPEAIAEPDPDEAEVIGQRNVIADGEAGLL